MPITFSPLHINADSNTAPRFSGRVFPRNGNKASRNAGSERHRWQLPTKKTRNTNIASADRRAHQYLFFRKLVDSIIRPAIDTSPLVHPNPRAANDFSSTRSNNLYLSRNNGTVLSRTPSLSRYENRGDHTDSPGKPNDAVDESKDSDDLLTEALKVIKKIPSIRRSFYKWNNDLIKMRNIKNRRIQHEEARVKNMPWQERGREPGSVVQAWGEVDRMRVHTPEPDHNLADAILDDQRLKEHPEMTKSKYSTLVDYLYMG